MLSDELPKQIELLVDTLRRQRSVQLSLTDVASVTEVLIATTQAFFRSIDTSVYKECRALSDYISNARKEIAALQPGDLEEARIPRAGLELDAIVQQTEDATNTIMTAAEEIMSLDTEDAQAYQATVQDNVMKIFEACSFQDITGQRISKVVETLAYIETRVLELRDLLGITESDIEEAHKENAEPIDEDKALLRGPALEGEGIAQDEVDALMGGKAAAPQAIVEPTPAPPVAPKAAAPAAPKAAPPVAPKAAAPVAPKPAPKPVAPPPEPVPAKMLDSMFQEDFDVADELEAQAKAKAAAEEKEKAAKAKAAAPAPKPEAKAAPAAGNALPESEEVSQDDIDALFG